MKKTHVGQTVRAATLLVCFIVLLTTCKNNIGMGGTVDINPPTIRNDSVYPPNNAIIKGAFTLAVKVDDDTGVNAVTAVITTADAHNSKINIGDSFLTQPSSDDEYWTLDIDPKGQYPIGDGAYKVEIQATDTAGKVSTITSAFTIDNTPPLLVLDRPSTAVLTPSASYKDGDTFGDAFWLIGQVYDKSPVAKLEITAAPVGGGTEYTQVINNVPANIRLKVDSFSEDKLKSKFYCALYGTNQSAGKKSFRYSLKVTDNAREYKNPADNAGSGEGNTSNIYYLKDDIDQKVMRNRRLQDIYAVLYGARPESITAEDAATIKAELANPANRIGGKGRTGVFGLNPALNPTFAVIGKTPSRDVSGALTPEFSKFYEGASLQVRFSRNLDDVALKPVDPVAPANDPYQFYLVKWETYKGYSSDPSFNINEDASRPGIVRIQRTAVETQDGSYVFTIPVYKTGELEYNKNYVLLVSGKDIDGHELIAVQNEDGANLYGIKLSSTNEPPEVTVTEINGNTNVTERIFVKEGGSVKFKIRLNKQASVTHKLIGAHSSFTPSAALYSAVPNEHEIEIPASEFDQGEDGSYRLTVKAEADGAESFEQTYHIFYDVKKPEVRITEPFGNLYGTQGTGLVIKGTAFDAGSGLADTNPVTVTLTKEDGSNVSVTFATDKKREAWELQPINLPEGTYTLTVTAKDKVGHPKTETLTFTYDKAVPVIKDIKIDDKDNFPVINKTGTFKVKGTVEETYGIKDDKIKIGNEEYTFSSIASSPYFFEKELTRAEGSYDIVITVKDKANNQTSETRTVIVDKTAPVFESIKIATTENVQNGNSITTNSGTVAIKGKIKETGSGVKKLEYQVEGDSDWKELSAANKTDGYYFEGSADIPVNTAKKLFLKVTDNADWITSWECRVTVVPPAVIQWKFGLENNSSPSGTVQQKAGMWYAKGQFKVKIGGVSNPVPSDDAITVKIEKKDASGTIAPSSFFDNWTGNEPKVSTTDTSKKYPVKSGLADGTYTITIKASNNQEQSLEFTVDGTKPTITPATSGAGVPPAHDSWVTTKAPLVAGTADDATSGIEKIEAIVNGTSTVLGTMSPWSGYLTLNEGNNTVQFEVTDKAGNSTKWPSAPRTIKVDIGRPTISLTTPANGQTFVKDETYQVTVNVSDVGASGIAKVEYTTDAGFASPQHKPASGSSVSINLTGITANTTYYFRAVDEAGNKSDSVRVNIVKDTAGPTINVISPLETSVTTQRPVFKASISDGAGIKAGTAKVYYKKVTVPPSTTEQSFTLTQDSDGSYTVTPAADMDEGHYELYFSAEDELGNKTSTKPTPPAPPQKITIDKAPPALADVKVNSKTDNIVYIKDGDGDVTVTGKATDSYGIVRVGIWEGSTEKLHTESVASDGSWTLTFSGSDALADGTHNLTIRATDKADKKVEVQKAVVVDRIAPTITPTNLPSAGAWLTTQQLFITGTTSDATSGVKTVEAVVTGGSPSNENQTLLSGTVNWSGNLTLNKGENKIKFRVTDNAGNSYETPETTVKVDIDRPTIALTTPANGQVLINGNAYTVTVTVNDVGASGIAKVEYTTDAGFASPQHEPASGGSVPIPLSGITADTTYYFRAVDTAGNVSDSVRVIIQKDSTPPEVSFVSHQDNQEVNKKITIIGSASDNRELKSVKIVKAVDGSDLTGVSNSSGADPSNPDTADGKALFVGTKAYNWRFTLDTTGYPDNAELKLKAIAADAAGNQTEKELTLKVNQDSDRPVVTVTNFTRIADANLVGSRILTGKVEDDDGPISAADIKIRVSPATNASGIPIGPSGSFETVTASNGVWRYTIPADKTDGKYHLDFELKDAAGTEFKTQAASSQARPFVMGYEDGPSDRKDQNIKFRLDTIQPEFKTGGVSFVLGASFSGSSEPVTPYAIIGNHAHQHASFRVFVYDASGIKKVELKLNNGAAIPGTHTSANDADGYEAWDFTNVQLVEGEGAVTLAITATDNANFDKTWQEAIITDFTAPTIGVEASTLNTVYYRNADIIGSVTETGSGKSGIDEGTIQYEIGNSGWQPEKHQDGTELSRLEKTSATWKVIIPDISQYDVAHGAVAPTAPGDKKYKLPLRIKVRDKAGNETISTVYQIQFDPAGSTPIVELISPDANATLGTTVLVSGLARKTKPDATGTVQRIELQLSETGVFGNPWILNGQNYGGTATTGITLVTDPDAYWQKTLDAAVITDILGSADSKTVWFRVRGVSSTGAEGEWTTGRKFTISKDAAQFSDIKLAIGSTETPYVPNGTWIRGDDYIIKGSVTHSQGIKAPPALKAKTENAGSSIKPLDTSTESSWFTPRPDGKGYDFAIKIKTSHYPEKSGSIEFDIIAEDARTTGAITVRTQIRLQYDNSIPEVAIGAPVVKGAHAAFSAGTFTPETALTAPKERYVVIANNKRYTVSSISGSSVTLNPADLTGNFDYAIAERPAILQGANCQIEGIGEDSGAGIQKVVITLTVKNAANEDKKQEVTLNAADSPRTIDPQRNNLASFKGTLNTTMVPNGQGTLKVTAYDGAGNEISDEITTIRVKNSPLAISKVTLRTDLDGDGKYPDSHPAPATPIADEKHDITFGGTDGLNDEKDFRGTADVKDIFTYKNDAKSELKVELTGGYGSTRKIVLYKDDASNASNKITEKSISSGTTTLSSYALDLAGKLGAIGDGDARKLIIRVYDGSVGELWYAEAIITVKVAHSDSQNPSGVIAPFFYNTDKTKFESADDFKLTSVKYDASTKQPLGHIEIAPITGLNAHPSVSGTVILRGIAYDNARIKELNLSGAGISRTITNTSGTWNSDSGFKVVKNDYSRTGHYVEWEYEWATGTPALAQTVTLTVTDTAPLTNGNGVSEPALKTGTRDSNDDRVLTLAAGQTAVKYQFLRFVDGEKSYLVQVIGTEDNGAKIRWTNANVPIGITQYRLYEPASNKASLTVNIVPFITEVVTALSTADSAGKGAFSRASTGEYPVRIEDTIAIKGFNLSSGTVMLGSDSLGSMPSVSITDSHTSGELSVKVGTVESVNNKVDVTKPYNKEGNGINNDTLTVNRKLFVWKNKTVINNNFMESPQFVMDKNSDYYMSLGSLASGSGGMRFYLVKNPDLDSNVSSMTDDAHTFEQCYSKYHNTAVAFDESGNMYGAATNTDKASGSTSFTFFSRSKGSRWSGTGANYYTGTKKRRLENSENSLRSVYDVNRVQIPKFAIRGTTSNAKVGLVYYDRNNNTMPVKFRYGTVGSSANAITGGLSYNVESDGTDSSPGGSGSAEGYEIVADAGSSHGSGQYAAVGLTSTNRAIIVWYDATNSNLVYSYRDMGASYTEPTASNRYTNDWQNHAVVIDGGAPLYVDLVLDDQDGLHIGYYSSSKSGVRYAYLAPEKVKGATKPATGDFKIATVDTFMNPGSFLKIGVREEAIGSEQKQVPYLSYYHSGFSGSKNAARMAWLKGGVSSGSTVKDGVENHKFTGDWVVMTVPATAGIQQYTICQGVPTGGTYANKVIAAYFTNRNYEMAILKK